jgi:energy-coupling factor transporter ATP-binding protein EcfA2
LLQSSFRVILLEPGLNDLTERRSPEYNVLTHSKEGHLTEQGKTIALYGDSGSGKTTQAGEYAKYVRRTRGRNSVLFSSDMGGFDSVNPLVRAGVVTPIQLGPDDDPWMWINDAATGRGLPNDIGLAIFDGGTSQSEALLSACAHSEWQIGQRPNQKFTVSKGTGSDKRNLVVPSNTDAHYGIVQSFMLDAIWKSTFLTRKGIDVLWTFAVHRGEEQDRTPILGPKLAGKALTAAVPKWFAYTFMLSSLPVEGEAPRHVLYTTEHSELSGMGHSFGNARYPLGVTPLPAVIEPASLVQAMELIEKGQAEADQLLRDELGL